MKLDVFYSPLYVSGNVNFDTTRKAQWVAEALEGVRLVSPRSLTVDDLLEVHEARYVKAIKTGFPVQLADSSGLEWDWATWDRVRSSNGGVVCATEAAVKHGAAMSLSSGLHHASMAGGEGFCTFNGLALAALRYPTAIIIDFDAHCGGGTEDILYRWCASNVRHVDIATSEFDKYFPSFGTLDIVRNGHDYLKVVEERLDNLSGADIAIYNAGVDPYEGCLFGGLYGITLETLKKRDEMVVEWAKQTNTPLAGVLAGGYEGQTFSRRRLTEAHVNTVNALARLVH